MTIEMSGETSVEIAAKPERVYALISDVTRMGEWSPECAGGEWIEPHTGPQVGAQFHGRNKRGENEWTTPNTVMVADAGREFAWVVGTPDFQVCRWRFTFAPTAGGTRVTESFELGKEQVGFASMVMERPEHERPTIVEARRAQLIEDMQHTLQRVKECVEGG